VNHLVTRYRLQSSELQLVSRGVARAIALEIRDDKFRSFVLSLSLNQNNPTFKGWLFEMLFLHVIVKPGSKPLSLKGCLIGDARSSRSLEFSSAIARVYKDFNILKEYEADLSSDCWLIPSRWNNGGFDCLQLLPSASTIRMVQITSAASHSLKMMYVRKVIVFLNDTLNLSFKNLEVYFIVPPNKSKDFSIKKDYVKDKKLSQLFPKWVRSDCIVLEWGSPWE